jgi:hypothetical protein
VKTITGGAIDGYRKATTILAGIRRQKKPAAK